MCEVYMVNARLALVQRIFGKARSQYVVQSFDIACVVPLLDERSHNSWQNR